MADFIGIVDWCLQQEDRGLTGVTKNLNDGGGRTRFGIAEHFNPGLPADFYTCDTAKALKVAQDVYKRNYWDRFCGDQVISDDVASCLLSFGINDGTSREIKMLQTFLGLPADGVMGPNTLRSTNAADPTILANGLRAAQAAWYHAIVAKQPTDARFLRGWILRASRVYPELD